MPPSHVRFSNYCTMNQMQRQLNGIFLCFDMDYNVFPIQINSKIEIRGSNPCQRIKISIELSLHLVFDVKVFGQKSVEQIVYQLN